MKTAIVIMAKHPAPGDVKTRLCPPLSVEEAAELYRCFLLDKIDQVRALPGAAPLIAFTPGAARESFAQLAPGFGLLGQRGPDLGARLANCFRDLFAGGYTAALAIDSDTPTLPRDFLVTAIQLAASPEVDVVLGPSEDGGYYLIGLRVLHPELFADIAWSTPSVLPETVRRAQSKGLRVACLPRWFDVDTPDDLARLRRAFRTHDPGESSHTRRFFARQ